jgi:hypothetical protein
MEGPRDKNWEGIGWLGEVGRRGRGVRVTHLF